MTWANQVRILKQNFEQLASVIGGTLINAFKPFVKALNVALSHVTNFVKNVSNALGAIFGWKIEINTGGMANDMEDFAESADSAASGIGDATSNAKALKKALSVLPFDELNQLSSNTNPDGASGGGGGTDGGSGLGSSAGMQANIVKTDSLFGKYESDIKNLKQLGKYIGDSLKNALDSIKWDSIYEKARNFGKGLADFLNGLISPGLFASVGKTIAGALNTAIYTALSFGMTFDFENLGLSIAEGINEFFSTFDFASLAKTINTWVQGIFNTIKTAIFNIKWSKVWEGIKDFLGNIELETVAIIVGTIAIKKIAGVVLGKNVLKSISKSIGGKLSGAFKDFTKEVKDSGSFLGTLKGKIKGVQSSMSTLTKVSIGAVGVLGDFALTKSGFYDIASGADNLTQSIGKIAGGAGMAFGALKLIGMSNPFAAVVTGATSLIGALVGIDEALENNRQIEMYGDTLDNINKKIETSTEDIKLRHEASVRYVEEAGVGEMMMAQDMADRYFELAKKTNLTNDEKNEMQRLSEKLVEYFPELEGVYNRETGLINATRESVERLIEQRLNDAKVQAAEEQLVEMYKQQYEQLGNVEEALGAAKTAQEEWDRLTGELDKIKELQGMWQQYQELGRQIQNTAGNTGELTDKQKELIEQQDKLWKTMEESGLVLDRYAKDGGLQAYFDEAEQAVRDFEDEYNQAMGTLSTAKIEYDSITTDIEKMKEMVYTGMSEVATDGAEGFANAANSETLTWDASIKQADDVLNAWKDSHDSHSPSKKYMEFAKDDIDGYVNGSKQYRSNLEKSSLEMAEVVMSKFREGMKNIGKVASEIPTVFVDAAQKIKIAFADMGIYFFDIGENIKNSITTALSGVTGQLNGFVQLMSLTGINAGQALVNGFQSIYIPVPHIDISGFSLHRIGNKGMIYTPQFKASWYANGGFPEEGPFFMNRGEIAGKFSNGKGVVANNEQITQGIADAVYPAVYNAVMTAMSNSSTGGGNPEYIMNNIEIDGEVIARAVTKGQQRIDRRYNPSPQF